MKNTTSVSNSQSDVLDIRDLLQDAQADRLSDYLTLSISSDGNNTTVRIATTAIPPETFTAVLHGIAASNLQMLLNETVIHSSPDSSL